MSDLAGYAKVMSWISITPRQPIGTLPLSLNGSISDARSIVLKSSPADDDAFVKVMDWGATVVIAVAATMTARITTKTSPMIYELSNGQRLIVHTTLAYLSAGVHSDTLPKCQSVP